MAAAANRIKVFYQSIPLLSREFRPILNLAWISTGLWKLRNLGSVQNMMLRT